MKSEYPVQALCASFEVSRSGYYDWSQRQSQPGPRALEDAALSQQIAAIYQEQDGTYGSPRICQELARDGQRHGRNRIARLMREQGLSSDQKARFQPHTTDSNHDLPIAPNRLRAAVATGPNQIWVADITYIQTAQDRSGLAFSRRHYGPLQPAHCRLGPE